MSVGSFLWGTLQNVWEAWNLRMSILLSMTLQIILVLFAPFRKRSSSRLIKFFVWLAYLLANWAAAYCIGLISKSQIKTASHDTSTDNKQDLLALWAPFLLLHLGGPDSITAFALEDNALWIRHLLNLILQVAAAAYVSYQTLPKNRLIIPTIFMFITGIIKYLERTISLYFANPKSFKKFAGPDYARLMDVYASWKEAHVPAKIEIIAKPKREVKWTYYGKAEHLTESNAIKHAYHFFNIFKGLIVGQIFSFQERNKSREFFLVSTPDDAMKVIAIELNFLYDSLFTKAHVVHSYYGYGFRTIAASSVVATLVLFYRLKNRELPNHDVIITYILLGAAISLEVIALVMLIFSDWTVAQIKDDEGNRVSKFLRESIGKRFLLWNCLKIHNSLKSTTCEIRSTFKYDALDASIFSRRWSESIPAFNLLSYCLKEHPERIVKKRGAVGTFFWWLSFIPKLLIKVIKYLVCGFFILTGKALNFVTCGCSGYIARQISQFAGYLSENINPKDILDDMKYVTRNPFIKDLWDLIFKELQDKSIIAEDAETASRMSESRGQWVLWHINWEQCEKLMKYIEGIEYDRSILLWHIATELCYHTDDHYDQDDKFREYCKIISDYMLYLLVKQATMLSAVAGISMIRYQDTCAEVKKFVLVRKNEMEEKKSPRDDAWTKMRKFFCKEMEEKKSPRVNAWMSVRKFFGGWMNEMEENKRPIDNAWTKVRKFVCLISNETNDQERLRQACRMILDVDTSVQPVYVKGDRSKSVLFDACILSKHLKELKEEMWGIMFKVWVEMLSYGASHCRAETHTQLLSKGGEFNTFVWVLMAHLGLGEQFQINEGHARAKLIVAK